MTTSAYKRCPRCGEQKPVAFHNPTTQYCKSCNGERSRRWREANRKRYNAHQSAYRKAHFEKARASERVSDAKRRQRPEVRAYYLEKYRRYGQANPEKRSAHSAVQAALKRGELERPAVCSSCGTGSRRIEAHHPDYDKPLEVIWLCTVCHRRDHPNV